MTKYFISGKLYKPTRDQRNIPISFHEKNEHPNEDYVEKHSFVLFLGSQYDEKAETHEHFFLDENGKMVALWGNPETVLIKYFDRIK